MTYDFSKKDTLTVKGIAIIFLICYHCFSSADRLCGYDVSLAPFSRSTAFYLFESMNICVGMFAFLSSYGLTKTIMFKNRNLELDNRTSSEFITKRTISLLSSFLIPYLLCTVPTLIFTDFNPYGTDIGFFFNFIADMFGVAGFIGSKLMIGTWWYMSFALVIIFLLPLTVRLYKKFGVFCVVPYIVVPVLLDSSFLSAGGLTNMTRWLLTIPMGIIIADLKIFERLKKASPVKNKVVSKIIKLVILTAVLVFLVIFKKTDWCEKYFFYFISSLLPVYFIYYIYEFICDIPILNTVLSFLGKHSSNIFFVHTFVRYVWFKDIAYSLGNWSIIFLFVLAVSLLISIVIMLIQWLVRWNKFLKFISDKAVKFCNKILDAEPAVS